MKSKRILAMTMAAVLGAGTLSACGTAKDSSTAEGASSTTAVSDSGVDISKEVNLVYYLWGSAGVANDKILAQINTLLKRDINATLEVKYIDWGDVATKYPLLFASGEQFDMAHASPTASVSYYTLAGQGALCDITDMLGTVAPDLKAAIPENTWTGAKYKGKIYGVPCLYSEYTPNGFAYRSDLLTKYGMDKIASVEDMETYCDNVLKNETYPPINGNANDAFNTYRMLIDTTAGWISAPGIGLDQMYLAATSADKYSDVFSPVFTQEFEDWAVKMSDWAKKGYWPTDILSAQVDAKANLRSSNSAGYLTHAQDWIGQYGADIAAQPESNPYFYCYAEANNKIKRKMGVENSTVISANSKNPERALMAIDKFMNDEEYYDLIQYGIEGTNYEVVDGVKKTPAAYDEKVDAGGFAVWSLRNDKFNLKMDTENPIREELYKQWDGVAINDPYMGFSFDSTNVASQISSITNVNSQLGMQLMLGKTQDDPKAAVEEYRAQLKQAGIDEVIAEVKSQLADFTPVK